MSHVETFEQQWPRPFGHPAPDPRLPGYSASGQLGKPGRCYLAKVRGPDGATVATIEPTEDPAVATALAFRMADALNAKPNAR